MSAVRGITPEQADNRAMVLLLASVSTIGLLSNDIFLPLLPILQGFWSVNSANSVLLLVHFLMVMGLTQLFYPLLIDRLGQRRVLLLGLGLCLVASLVLSASSEFDDVLRWRTMQAVGVALSLALSRVILRTRLPAEQAARGFMLMASFMGVMPAVAPVLGFALYEVLGVRACFIFTALFSCCAIGGVTYWVRRDRPQRSDGAHKQNTYLAGYREILAAWKFWRYASVPTFAYAAYFSYVCASPYLLERGGLSVREIAYSYIVLSATYLLGTLVARRITRKRCAEAAITLGYALFLIGGLGVWWQLEQPLIAPLGCITAMSVLTLGNGFLLPFGTAATLGVSVHQPMLLPALLGFMQFCTAAAVAFVASRLLLADPAAVGRLMAVIVTGGFVLNTLIRYFENIHATAVAD